LLPEGGLELGEQPGPSEAGAVFGSVTLQTSTTAPGLCFATFGGGGFAFISTFEKNCVLFKRSSSTWIDGFVMIMPGRKRSCRRMTSSFVFVLPVICTAAMRAALIS